MKKIIYYYSATGNSLYAARFLQSALEDFELRSIPKALFQEQFDVEANSLGFVFPLHSMGLPMQVESFLERLSITGRPYIFSVVTCGVPYIGQPFADADAILTAKNQRLRASWYVRLVSNYLPLGDIPAEWRINIRARFAERKLRKIAKAIRDHEAHSTWQLLGKPCHYLHEKWKSWQQKFDEKFLCNTELCISCGLCERICPAQNILRPEGHPVWQHRCVNCLGCIHICPAKAIDYGEKTNRQRRYRHKDINPIDLLHDFTGSRTTP